MVGAEGLGDGDCEAAATTAKVDTAAVVKTASEIVDDDELS